MIDYNLFLLIILDFNYDRLVIAVAGRDSHKAFLLRFRLYYDPFHFRKAV